MLFGEGGRDLLVGGAGSDTLTGGSGADHFEFSGLSKGHDVVTDLSSLDFLRLASHLFVKGSISAESIVTDFARVVDGNLQFVTRSASVSITLLGIESIDGLADQIILI